MIKKVIMITKLIALMVSVAFIFGGCGVQDKEVSSDLPKYTVVNSNDISIPGKTRMAYWIAIDEQIDDTTAETIAIAASKENKSIDEVTVWIYDDEKGAKSGYLWDQMYQVDINKGKIADTIENPDYDPDFNPDSLLGDEESQQNPSETPYAMYEIPKELADKIAEADGIRTLKQEYSVSGTWIFGKSTIVVNDLELADAKAESDFYLELLKYSYLKAESDRAISICDAQIEYSKEQINRIIDK